MKSILKSYWKALFASSLGAILFVAHDSLATANAADRPNILFIFSDDHAQAAISAYGSKVNQTPNIDRLAAEGARFANSFVTNSICTPSRATLLTGQYSHLNGVPVFNSFDGKRDHLGKRLQGAGYHTGMIGKCIWEQIPLALTVGSCSQVKGPIITQCSSLKKENARSKDIAHRSQPIWVSSSWKLVPRISRSS